MIYNELKFSENKFIKIGEETGMTNFIGREQEISLLQNELKKASAAVMIYGKRKVGKTTLITHTLGEAREPFVYYECLKSSLSENIAGFVTELVRSGVLPVSLTFSSFPDVFAYLSTLGKTLNIVIDEYPYLKMMTAPETVDSQFQTVIDNYLGHIRLFLSGSHIGMMKDMLAERNALYGRFSLTLQLKELNYREAASFYAAKSVYEKVALYSVFGGSPFVNGFIDPEKSLKENVIATVLNPTSPLYNYAEHLLVSDYANAINAERIMYAISNGKKKYGEMEDLLGMKNNGLLSKQLETVLRMELIVKKYPINRPEDKKKTTYELGDNLLRFYYAFVYKNKSALAVLGPEAFYEEYIEKSIVTFISFRFEEICRTYFSLLARKGRLRGVLNIGTYYFDDASARKNGEYDVVLQRREAFDIYEVKYLSEPLDEKRMLAEAEKIRNVKGLPLGKIGFVSVSGFDTERKEFDLIDGEMLYAE